MRSLLECGETLVSTMGLLGEALCGEALRPPEFERLLGDDTDSDESARSSVAEREGLVERLEGTLSVQ